jgi:hypothetical protein
MQAHALAMVDLTASVWLADSMQAGCRQVASGMQLTCRQAV